MSETDPVLRDLGGVEPRPREYALGHAFALKRFAGAYAADLGNDVAHLLAGYADDLRRKPQIEAAGVIRGAALGSEETALNLVGVPNGATVHAVYVNGRRFVPQPGVGEADVERELTRLEDEHREQMAARGEYVTAREECKGTASYPLGAQHAGCIVHCSGCGKAPSGQVASGVDQERLDFWIEKAVARERDLKELRKRNHELLDQLEQIAKATGYFERIRINDKLPPLVEHVAQMMSDRMVQRDEVARLTAVGRILEVRVAAESSAKAALVAAIKRHHGQKADDRCFEDDVALYKAAGLNPADVHVGDKFEMLKNCARFIEKRCECRIVQARAEGRREALEQAARVADDYAEGKMRWQPAIAGARIVATAIRALDESEPEKLPLTDREPNAGGAWPTYASLEARLEYVKRVLTTVDVTLTSTSEVAAVRNEAVRLRNLRAALNGWEPTATEPRQPVR